MSGKRVLVTGAAGFLGQHVVSALAADGWEVWALVHRRDLPARLQTDAVRVIHGDVGDTAALAEPVRQADAVCHLAAFIPPDYEDAAFAPACMETNALATLRLAQRVLERPERRFLYLSAGNAYAPMEGPASETDALYPAGRAAYYLVSKVTGEIFVERLRRKQGLAAVSLRVSTPYGPGMPERSAVARFVQAARRGLPLEVWDGGIPAYDFVYVADVAALIAAALKAGQPGVYNAGSGVAHSILDLARSVAATFGGREAPIEVKPPRGVVPDSFPALRIERAAAAWNYRPRTLGEGLAAYRRALEDTP